MPGMMQASPVQSAAESSHRSTVLLGMMPPHQCGSQAASLELEYRTATTGSPKPATTNVVMATPHFSFLFLICTQLMSWEVPLLRCWAGSHSIAASDAYHTTQGDSAWCIM